MFSIWVWTFSPNFSWLWIFLGVRLKIEDWRLKIEDWRLKMIEDWILSRMFKIFFDVLSVDRLFDLVPNVFSFENIEYFFLFERSCRHLWQHRDSFVFLTLIFLLLNVNMFTESRQSVLREFFNGRTSLLVLHLKKWLDVVRHFEMIFRIKKRQNK